MPIIQALQMIHLYLHVPLMEYAPLTWAGAAQSHLSRLDMVQRKAMKIIGRGTLLDSLNVRRAVCGLTYLYKLFVLSGPSRLKDVLPPFRDIPPATTRTRSQSVAAANCHSFFTCDRLFCQIT